MNNAKASTVTTLVCFASVLIASGCGGSVVTDDGPGIGGSAGSAGTGGSAGATGGMGGSAGATGGTGGNSTGGTGGASMGGSGGSLPDGCATDPGYPGPYAVAFQFESYAPQPVYLLEQCRITHVIKTCTDDYQASVDTNADCSSDCADPEGVCIQCEQCLRVMVPVGGDITASLQWPGNTYTFDTNAAGCPCHNRFVAPAGKYRIEVPVYDTEVPEAVSPIHTATLDFTLPSPDGIVRVDVTPAFAED
jgi:hypothetical protein